MRTYFIKTRNWNGKKNIHALLSLSHKWGAQRGDSYTDGDGKFYVEAKLPLAVFTWLYYKALQPWSGGMVIWQAV